MTPTNDSATAYTIALLNHYGFELGGYNLQELVTLWLNEHQENWVRLAAIESLYQGLYKSISVGQILAFWSRRGRPIYHFNHEFERIICRKFPQNLADIPLQSSDTSEELNQANTEDLDQYNYQNLPIENSLELDASEPLASDSHSREIYTEYMIFDASEISESPPDFSTDLVEPDVSILTEMETPDEAAQQSLTDISFAVTETPEETLSTSSLNPNFTYYPDWSRFQSSKHPIHQFTPIPDASDFYLKLKAVALSLEDSVSETSLT